ncbi:MAG: hypothetical protein ACREFQ_01920, partial [Stellaceae bacterium]
MAGFTGLYYHVAFPFAPKLTANDRTNNLRGMSDIVNVLRAEYGEIAADIRANPDPRAVKLERIAALLASYGARISASDPSAARPIASEKAPQTAQQALEREKAPTKRERVRA